MSSLKAFHIQKSSRQLKEIPRWRQAAWGTWRPSSLAIQWGDEAEGLTTSKSNGLQCVYPAFVWMHPKWWLLTKQNKTKLLVIFLKNYFGLFWATMEMYTLPELSLFIIKGGRMSLELLKRCPPSEQLLSKAFRTKWLPNSHLHLFRDKRFIMVTQLYMHSF